MGLFIFIVIITIIILLIWFIISNSQSDPPAPAQRTAQNRAIDYEQQLANYNAKIASAQSELANLTQKIAGAQSDYDKLVQYSNNYRDGLYQSAKENVDIKIENYAREELEKLNSQYRQHQLKLEDELTDLLAQYEEQTDNAYEALDNVHRELDEWYSKQDAINQEILRREQIEKEHEKYYLGLSTTDKADITYLLDLNSHLNKKTTLPKFVWSEYVLPAFNKMIKLQFGGKVPKSVIYMITINDKKYIGKTKQDISTRWTSHIKTSLGIDGTLTQDIHKALAAHLADASFQVLEANIPDEQLNTREKFYISQYQTDKYGFNMKAGG